MILYYDCVTAALVDENDVVENRLRHDAMIYARDTKGNRFLKRKNRSFALLSANSSMSRMIEQLNSRFEERRECARAVFWTRLLPF